MFQDCGHAGCNWTQSTFPRNLVMRRGLDRKEESVEHVWNNYYSVRNASGEMPEFVRNYEIGFNFACGSVQIKQWDSSWDFSAFLESFDSWVWVSLVFSLILVGLLVNTNIGHSFSPILLPSVGVLLNGGVELVSESE